MRTPRAGAIVLLIALLIASSVSRAGPATQPEVLTRLGTPIDQISFEGLGLPEAIALVGQRAHVNFAPDWPSITRATTHFTRIKLQGQYRNLLPRQLIEIAFTLAQIPQPEWSVENNMVMLGGSEVPGMETRILRIGPRLMRRMTDASHDVADRALLLPAGPEELISVVRTMVESDHAAPGETAYHLFGDRMVVRQTPANLDKVQKFLQQLEADLAK